MVSINHSQSRGVTSIPIHANRLSTRYHHPRTTRENNKIQRHHIFNIPKKYQCKIEKKEIEGEHDGEQTDEESQELSKCQEGQTIIEIRWSEERDEEINSTKRNGEWKGTQSPLSYAFIPRT